MKCQLLSAFAVFSIFVGACKKSVEIPTPCIEQKIEEWKQKASASAIYRIDAPEGALYWFVDNVVDAGEYIYDKSCQPVCVTDLEGFDPQVNFCIPGIFDAPRTKIWER